MSPRDAAFHAAISELANALQTAAPIATRLRRDLGDQAEEAQTLEAALDRAVRAARQLQRRDRTKGGDQ